MTIALPAIPAPIAPIRFVEDRFVDTATELMQLMVAEYSESGLEYDEAISAALRTMGSITAQACHRATR